MDLTSKIIEFEGGSMNDEDTIELFQVLVDNGMAWTLQGFYGRIAKALIEAELIVDRGIKVGLTPV